MNEKYMKLAIEEAKKALKMGEVPVGAVIVYQDEVIAKAYNIKEKERKVTKHAEIIAVEKAEEVLNNWRLNDCDIYVTLEPCPMCASAIRQARVRNVYVGVSSKDKLNYGIISSIFNNNYSNPIVHYSCGYLVSDIQQIMDTFFRQRREKNSE